MSFQTFISDDLSKKFGLKCEGIDTFDVAVFGSETPNKTQSERVTFGIQTEFGETLVIKANSRTFLSMPAPTSLISPVQAKALLEKEKQIMEIRWLKPDVICGMDNFHCLQIRDLKRLNKNLMLSDSALGPFISGTIETQQGNNEPTLMNVSIEHHDKDKCMDNAISNFFLLNRLALIRKK